MHNNEISINKKIYSKAPDKDNLLICENEKLLKEWMQKYGNDVLRTAYFFMKDTSLADDVFQEVFIKLYKNIGSYRGKSNVKTWILKITINQCKDQLKSAWFKNVFRNINIESTKINDINVMLSPENSIIVNEEKRELLDNVINLPLHLREVLILYYYNFLNEKEISSMLHIPQGTVRSRLHRAKQALKKNMCGRNYNEIN